jgi:hypothetical protein
MDNMNPVPVNAPPQIPATRLPGLLPLGEAPGDTEPITNAFNAIEAVLRQPRRLLWNLRQPRSGGLMGAMVLAALLCALVYGAVVGTFSMGTQLWAAPVKVAAGLLISALICLPSLYIFSCLSGSHARLTEICGLLVGLLLLLTLLLIGFAPVAWLFSQSTQSVAWMGALHLLFWFVATCFGLRFLYSGFRHSQAQNMAGVATWTVLFVLVMLQMTAALRPLVGTADTFLPKEKKFFLVHWGASIQREASPSRQTE